MKEKKVQTNLLNDLTFKKLFASEETKEITRHFLNDVAKINVVEISIRPTEVYSVKKMADTTKENDMLRTKVDLLVNLDNGQLATIELQNSIQSYFAERSLFYMAKGYITNYNETDQKITKYNSLRSVYGINIVNFKQHPASIADEVMRYVLKNEKHDLTLKNQFTNNDLWTLIFFELPKVNQKSTKILQEWASIFLTGKVSDEAPKYLKQAAEFIAFENLEKEERQMYINLDEHEAIGHAEIEGAIALGKEQGRELGLEEGLERGLEKGEERGVEQVAITMLRDGVSLEETNKYTGLAIQILKELQKKIN